MNHILFNDINGVMVGGLSVKEYIVGGNESNDVGIDRFDHLVVPLGLYTSMFKGGGSAHPNRKKGTVENEVIDNTLYDKLLTMVRYDIPNSNKTRKTRKHIKSDEHQRKSKSTRNR